jgi:hypothetical protein
MTFAQGVLRLVRAGAPVHTDGGREPDSGEIDAAAAQIAPPYAVELFADDGLAVDSPVADSMAALSHLEPGFGDIEAAVALVECGLATRVVLTGFPSWPGLLWQAYQLAEVANVLILPTVARPGGRVDIVIARDSAQNV